MMNLLKFIQQHTVIRKYKNKRVPLAKIKKIVEVGRWGPSIHRIQPWKFVIIHKKIKVDKFKKIISNKLSQINLPNFMLYPTISAVMSADLMIAVYNTRAFSNFRKDSNRDYLKNAELAEISAISAAIQNMCLAAEYIGIGSCWLDLPLFCKKEINEFLGIRDDLTAILTLGYPAYDGKTKRSPRKPITETVVIY